jgi:transaldolase
MPQGAQTMSAPNPVNRLDKLGQSVWIDYIERGFTRSGGLARLLAEDGVSGLTSNPAIFQKSIAENDTYSDAIQSLARAGQTAEQVHEALMIEDIRAAADLLAPTYARTNARDGYVSLEVSPHLARDTEQTFTEALRLWSLVDRENLMIKVPGTVEGVPVVQRLIAAGINVNVTLLFSVERYAAVAEAFVAGLEERARAGQPLARVASVASFFLSRIDTLLDPKIDASGDTELRGLRGEIALACARKAYAHYQSIVASARWRKLAELGAQSQRLLWASTSAKDPAYSDVKYVEPLVLPETVTTLPPETLAAYRDHGNPVLQRLDGAVSFDDVERLLPRIELTWTEVERQLEADGIKKFVTPHDAILSLLTKQISAVQ